VKESDFLRRLDELLAKAEEVRRTTVTSDLGGESWVDEGKMAGFRAACLSFLMSSFGMRHTYYQQMIERTKGHGSGHFDSACEILMAARGEVAGGWTRSLRSLITADIFSDFMDMGSYLLDEGYKDAAAVIIGSVLEEHLRQLAQSHGVSVEVKTASASSPKKADRLNADLAGAEVYGKLDQKSITAWLDLRNKAAHGKYADYTKEQVRLMHQALLEFMARTTP
jgi:hypothetical protein